MNYCTCNKYSWSGRYAVPSATELYSWPECLLPAFFVESTFFPQKTKWMIHVVHENMTVVLFICIQKDAGTSHLVDKINYVNVIANIFTFVAWKYFITESITCKKGILHDTFRESAHYIMNVKMNMNSKKFDSLLGGRERLSLCVPKRSAHNNECYLETQADWFKNHT